MPEVLLSSLSLFLSLLFPRLEQARRGELPGQRGLERRLDAALVVLGPRAEHLARERGRGMGRGGGETDPGAERWKTGAAGSAQAPSHESAAKRSEAPSPNHSPPPRINPLLYPPVRIRISAYPHRDVAVSRRDDPPPVEGHVQVGDLAPEAREVGLGLRVVVVCVVVVAWGVHKAKGGSGLIQRGRGE